MIFESYRQGATVAAELVNTVGSISQQDYMPDRPALRRFLDEQGLAPGRAVTQRDVRELHALRARLRPIFEASGSRRVKLLNDLLREIPAVPQLTTDAVPVLGLVPATRSIADQVTVAAITGLASTLAELGSDRLGSCEAEDCDDVFADVSKNGSRRFCSDSCGTRTHVAAYRARQSNKG